ADRDGDGYLNDAEFANRTSGFDARFEYESRLFYPFYGQMRFVTNPTSAAIKAWSAEFHQELMATLPLAEGFFLDNSNGKAMLNGAKVREATNQHNQHYAQLVKAVNDALPGKLVASNTAGARAEADPVAAASDIAFEEFLLRSTEANWTQVLDAKDIVDRRLRSANPSPYVVIDSHAGSTNPNDPRTQIGTLSYYYLLADPEKTFLMFNGGQSPSAGWNQKWSEAVKVDVGTPTSTMTTWATGTDPQNAALTYRIYGRNYSNALVLYKPRSYMLGKGTGTTADATATTHDLGGNYRAVNADGTLGPVIQTLTLRNGEGAMLIRA
ncbi:MAG: hypothetical protein ACRCZF_24975, partial [Gemmataceae bacterium]